MSVWRRLDHIALVVRDTNRALEHFEGTLGMKVVEAEELETPPVRLTFLDAGAITLQLVEPLAGNAPLTEYLAEHGEGLHHICFEVDELVPAIRQLSGGEDPELVFEGKRTRSAFVQNGTKHGLLIELTQERGPGPS